MFKDNSDLINLKKQLKEKNKYIKTKLEINKLQNLIVKDSLGNKYNLCKCCDVVVFPKESCFVSLDEKLKIFHPVEVLDDSNFTIIVRVILKSGVKYAYPLNYEYICLPILSDNKELLHGDILCAKFGILGKERFIKDNKQYFVFVSKLVSCLDNNLKIKTKFIANNLPFENPFKSKVIENKYYSEKDIENNLYLDFRHINFFTIDSENSKALDDAIAVEDMGGKLYKIYIAITDVDYILKENTDIDNYARDNVYSVYTPGFVVQMLPSSIAYREASLIPGFDRKSLVVSCVIDSLTNNIIDNTLEIKFATINSRCRFSFNDINRILIDNDDKLANFISNGLVSKDHLKKLQYFASSLNANSLLNGRLVHNYYKYLNFSTSIYNKVIGIEFNFKNLSQTIVESLMIWTNTILTEFAKKNIDNYPFVFVNHNQIHKKSVKKLRLKLLDIGLLFSIDDFDKIETFSIIAGELIKRGLDSFYNNILFRYMPKINISYNPQNHFSLALESYSTWTSPIRKYTDLWNLRRLKQLFLGLEFKGELLNLDQIEKRRGEFRRLTLEIEKMIIYNLLLSKVHNNIFNGKIVHYDKNGVIVEIINLGCVGLISIKQIAYKAGLLFDDNVNRFYNRNYKEVFLIGKFVVIEITKTFVNYNMIRVNYISGII